MCNWRLYIGILLIGCHATVNAAGVAMHVFATVAAVPCTTEQRARIRACLTPQQQLATAPYKTVITAEPRTGRREELGPRQEIRVDPSRQLMVRTLIY
jgi:hypothetical protein